MPVLRKLVLAACCALAAVCSDGYAQAYPAKGVKIIVPFPAGGLTDILARDVANQLAPRWGVSLIVENKGGASGTIGSEQVARAVGDPYLLMVTATHHVINPGLRKSLPYDTKRDFTDLALIGTAPNLLLVHPSFPAKTVADLIRMAKEKPGAISFASTGIGGANHLGAELFKVMAGVDMTHIPYKGEAPARSDLIAGHVPVMFQGLSSSPALIASGKVRALGTTTLKRLPSLPDIPTIDESGLKGFEVYSWFGLYGPAQLPAAAVAKISSDVNAVLSTPDIKARFFKFGAVDPGALSQVEFTRFVNNEIDKWGRVIEHAKIPKE